MVKVSAVTEVTSDLLDAMQRLLPQLSASAPPLSARELGEIVRSQASVLLVASVDDRIVGALTLAVFRIPTGIRAWIEDVVVDSATRGQGIGEALTRAAVQEAAGRGARTVDLTSRPSREAANRLYQRCGFELRQTNVYRYQIDS